MYCVNDMSVFTTTSVAEGGVANTDRSFTQYISSRGKGSEYWQIVHTILPRLLMYCVNDLSVFATPPSATDVLCERSVSIRYPSLGYWCIVWTNCQYSLPLPRLLMYCVNDMSVFTTPSVAEGGVANTDRSFTQYISSRGKGSEYWQIVHTILPRLLMYCVNDLSVFATPPSATDVLCERSVSIRYPSLGYWCIVWTNCQYSLPLPRLLMYCVNDMSVFTTPSLGYWCIVLNDLIVFATPPSATDVLCNYRQYSLPLHGY